MLLPARCAAWRARTLTLILSLGQEERRNKRDGTDNRRTLPSSDYCPKVLLTYEFLRNKMGAIKRQESKT